MKTQLTFQAVTSGDGECYCYAVDAETFTRITGNPPEKGDVDYNYPNRFRLYPLEVLHALVDYGKVRDQIIEINISAKLIGPAEKSSKELV